MRPRMRTYAYAVLAMTVSWFFLRGTLQITSLFEGIFFAIVTVVVTRGILKQAIQRPFPKVFRRLPWYVLYILFLAKNTITGTVDVAYRAFHPRLPVYPGILAVDVEGMSDLEVSMMANTITLTPGTLTVDVDMERKRMFVHTINARDLESVRLDLAKVGTYVERVLK